MKFRAILAAMALLFAAPGFAATWYVDVKATGANNGTSWVNAYTTIQACLNNASVVSGDEIWVGSGTYSEIRTGSAAGSLVLKAGVALYGGFKGNASGGFETARSQRDWFANPAIISGVNGRGAGLAAYHVVEGANNATVDGFTISGGNANGSVDADRRGAGVIMTGITMTIRNCIVRDNTSTNGAGGIKAFNSALTVDRCAFINNVCNSTFAGHGGGAICVETGPSFPTITNSWFYNNRAQGSQPGIGGGALTFAGSGVNSTVVNCSFYGNQSSSATAAPSPGTGTAGGGGAVYVLRGAAPTFRNCIFWGDSPANDEIRNHTLSGASAADNASLPVTTNCTIQGGYSGTFTSGLTTDPLYVSPGTGDLRLQAGSPARDSGTNTPSTPSPDYLGTARPLTNAGAAGGTIDRGAYEYDATPPNVGPGGANCVGQIVVLSAGGTFDLTTILTSLQGTVADGGGIKTTTLSPSTVTCANIPSTLVTLTFTDYAGNVSSCTPTVQPLDATDPTISSCVPNQNSVLNGSCQPTIPNMIALLSPNVSDACGIASITQSPPAGTVIASNTNVTFTVTDNNGRTATCNNTVIYSPDVTPPTINTCASNQTVNLGPACNALLPDLRGGVSATDNCGTPTISQSPAPGTVITANTLVTLTATDTASNTAQCTATVFVQDATDPVINTCASNQTISRSGICDALVPDLISSVAASDNCDTSLTITQSPTAGTIITSNTVVTITVTDDAGNDTTCQATMTLVDDTNPVIQDCPSDATVILDANCEALVPDLVPFLDSTDNCGVASEVQSPVAGTTITADTIVTFTVTDTSGNTATCQATVFINDTTNPVIDVCPTDQTLSLSANCDAQVPDFVALTTASDNCTVASLTQSPPAGTVIVANTLVTITATDGFNNSVQCTVNANVVDDTPPVITANGGLVLAYLTGQIYTEQGATASDNCDTNVPVTIGGDTVDTGTPGIYFVTYDAVDDDGNPATQVVRQVTVTLNTPPVITIIGDNPALVECQDGYTDEGATAFDADQGDITGDLITTGSVDVTTPGDYVITYEVTDNAFTTVQDTRIVQVRDNTDPTILITGANPLRHECSTIYNDPGATASDICDLTIDAGDIIVSNPVDENSPPGDYNVTYTVTDASGNTTVETRVVEVRDATIPVITLIGGPSVQHECGTVYNDLGASATDTCDGLITPLIITVNPVDANSNVGFYTVTYNVQDISSNSAVEVTREVEVIDTVRPVITLNGAPTVAINVNQPYNEQGATALDQCDGDVTAGIVIAGTVDITTPGSYVLTYDVTDSNGNPASQVTRTVLVQGSNSPPVFIDQPDDITINYNANAQFSVVAASPVAVTYRWRRNGVDLSDNAKFSGTGTATLTVIGGVNADEDDYSCRATNIFGNAISDDGVLTVLDPAIIEQPESRSVIAGSTVNVDVVAIGSGTLTYQWYKDGAPLVDGSSFTGTTTATLTITDAQNDDEGEYFVEVTGADGTLTSDIAFIEIGNPAIVTNPDDLTVDPGDTAVFTVVAQGTPPLVYRWRKNGVNLSNGGRFSGVNTTTLTITNCVESDEGAYDCIVVGQEIVVSDSATLTVNNPPTVGPIIADPVGAVFAPGGNGTLAVQVLSGTPPFTFQWTKDNVVISTKAVVNGTSQVLNVTNAAEADEGEYTCIVTNSAGQATAVPVTLQVGLAIFADLQDETVEDGIQFTWPVGIGGAIGNISFEWFKEDINNALQPISDGPGLTGTDTDELFFDPVGFDDDGFYQVTATDDSSATVTSRLAKLTVVSELPLAGGLGLALVAGVAALAGAASLRRKK